MMNTVTHFQATTAVRTTQIISKTRPLKVHLGCMVLKPILVMSIQKRNIVGALYWLSLIKKTMTSQRLSFM